MYLPKSILKVLAGLKPITSKFADLTVSPSKPAFSKPSTVIMVIGESASAYYMSAYSDVKMIIRLG